MGNVIKLLVKYGYHLLFLVLEFICFYLIVTYNNGQREIFINTSNILFSSINQRVDRINNFSSLGEVNDKLKEENAFLIRELIKEDVNFGLMDLDTIEIEDRQYDILPVTICNSNLNLNLQNNYITLCAGEEEGLTFDMGVISTEGVVGIIKQTSKHYSYVISILNSSANISCVIKRNNAHGGLVWPGKDSRFMEMVDVPRHLDVLEGDTIITSGYSTIFPKGIKIGTVQSYELISGSNSYSIEVKLFNDPSTLDIIYVIKNKYAQELIQLQENLK